MKTKKGSICSRVEKWSSRKHAGLLHGGPGFDSPRCQLDQVSLLSFSLP